MNDWIQQRVRITGQMLETSQETIPYYGAAGYTGIMSMILFLMMNPYVLLLLKDGGGTSDQKHDQLLIAQSQDHRLVVQCNHAHVPKPKAGLDARLLYAIHCCKIYACWWNRLHGATRQKLTQAAMRQMIIPKRSLDEQIEIVNIIKKVQGVIASRKEELEQLDLLIKARFVEMFL
ncbi:hypothetical protein [[Ruminococcus] lactaris]|uniref:hypothetical protein n=1 Tax=[Ruminococcus] lactaris TaxID=46228 RepID=UPI00242D8582|nr:hypothetical protein [[Ruminococcus] lactaris]